MIILQSNLVQSGKNPQKNVCRLKKQTTYKIIKLKLVSNQNFFYLNRWALAKVHVKFFKKESLV